MGSGYALKICDIYCDYEGFISPILWGVHSPFPVDATLSTWPQNVLQYFEALTSKSPWLKKAQLSMPNPKLFSGCHSVLQGNASSLSCSERGNANCDIYIYIFIYLFILFIYSFIDLLYIYARTCSDLPFVLLKWNVSYVQNNNVTWKGPKLLSWVLNVGLKLINEKRLAGSRLGRMPWTENGKNIAGTPIGVFQFVSPDQMGVFG